MQLSPNFSLSELTASQSAARRGLDNTPSQQVLDNLLFLTKNLEDVRSLLGTAILISSGYRSPALNKLIGGSKTSQHAVGLAADFTSPRFGTPAEIVKAIKASNINFCQLILEYDSWVHISFSRINPRRQTLIIDHQGTRLHP